MKLGDLITAENKINRDILIGKEIEFAEGEMLLLAIQQGEFYVESEGGPANATRLLALYDGAAEDGELAEWKDSWDETDDAWVNGLIEDNEEIITNRQAILNAKDESESVVLDVAGLMVNDRTYMVYEAEESWMDDYPIDVAQILRKADDEDSVSEKWQEKSLEELVLVEYIVEDSLMDIQWEDTDLYVEPALAEDAAEDDNMILSGKVIKCPCGRFDETVSFQVKSHSGKAVNVDIFGIHMLDVWSDADRLGLSEEELEEICLSDERLLVVEYKTDADAVMNFFTKSFLDAEASEGEVLPELMMGMEDHELQLIDIVPEYFDSDVELELLSYEVFED